MRRRISQRVLPSDLSRHAFAGKDIHAHDTELPSRTLLARAPERIEPLTNLDVSEADLRKNRNELSLRESTSNSTCPQIDVLADRLRELVRHHDVGIEEFSAGLEDAEDLAIRDGLVRRQIEDPVRDDEIDARRLEG